ncbi:MAG: hypothetical protein K0S93_57 [Nitrososphaeraceae archaeon]|jgi:hypothetical protein|nr:hypothetical protein [Nitrososphaeraceae archaeon]
MATELKQLLSNKQLLTILLPKTFNDGQKIQKRIFDQTFNEILDLFGGYSIGSTVKGAWKNNGKIYKDHNIQINIIVDNLDELTLSTLVNNLKERFKQLEIYTTIQQVKYINI